jgi:hypothetical protein
MVHMRVHLGLYLAKEYASVQPLLSAVRVDRTPTMPSSMTPRRGDHSCCTDEVAARVGSPFHMGRGGRDSAAGVRRWRAAMA